ncbi:uncharacterized protein LOC134006958 [Osmerus eperlanus]|uniref:uncharacterized protein LOC134006958 n=1 Tax=Osmerus eperlanus TaxID=29151 RepID=UPI002E0D37BF
MAKKSLLSKKSLKSMFSKSEANLESADTRIFEETVDVEKKKTVSTNKSLKAFFSKSDIKLNESAEYEDRYGGGKTSKFKKKTKNNKTVKRGLHENDISGAEAQGLGEARVQDMSPSVSRHDERTFLYGTAPRAKAEDLSVSELDLHKHRKFGTFTFGLLKRKKKSRGLSQSTTELHGPEVKGQEEEEEEPLDLDTRTFFSTVNPLPLDNQSLAMDFLSDSPDMSTVDKMMRRAPIATMPEFEWEEPIDVQRDVSDHDTDSDPHNLIPTHPTQTWMNDSIQLSLDSTNQPS